jgi:hypothetical protein
VKKKVVARSWKLEVEKWRNWTSNDGQVRWSDVKWSEDQGEKEMKMKKYVKIKDLGTLLSYEFCTNIALAKREWISSHIHSQNVAESCWKNFLNKQIVQKPEQRKYGSEDRYRAQSCSEESPKHINKIFGRRKFLKRWRAMLKRQNGRV